jgi:FkbM family methyltransferase
MKGFTAVTRAGIRNVAARLRVLGPLRRVRRRLAPVTTPMDRLFGILRELGFRPAHVVDIGANHGTWTRRALTHFPDAHCTVIEPQERLRESLSDVLATNPRVHFHAVGAGRETGRFLFTIADRDDSCTFDMTPEEASTLGYRQVETPVVTLNDLLGASGLPAPELIKIDAEGLDLDVLDGASNFLGRTEVFLVEASVVEPGFRNTVSNVLRYMDAAGYRLFDITELNRPVHPKVLWLVELVFILRNGKLDTSLQERFPPGRVQPVVLFPTSGQ